jgi:hypothetical protein
MMIRKDPYMSIFDALPSLPHDGPIAVFHHEHHLLKEK